MVKLIAHLGPSGTYTETVALAYGEILKKTTQEEYVLSPYPSIAQTLYSTANGETNLAIVPVENSVHGTVTITLDTIWELNNLQIQQGLDLPVLHCLLSRGRSLKGIKTVYSHPQALAQCQKWLEKNLPHARLIATNSTTEALKHINQEPTSGAIASKRASELYNLPIIATQINDYPDNCTRFWVVSLEKSNYGTHISLAFSFEENRPGILVKPLQIFAEKKVNLSKIESRPTKRILGEYLFFMDLEGNMKEKAIKTSLKELSNITKDLKIFGNYNVQKIESSQ